MQGALEVVDVGVSGVDEGRSEEEVMTGAGASVSLDVESKGGCVNAGPASILEDGSMDEDVDSASLEEVTSAEAGGPASVLEAGNVDEGESATLEEGFSGEVESPASLLEGVNVDEEGASATLDEGFPEEVESPASLLEGVNVDEEGVSAALDGGPPVEDKSPTSLEDDSAAEVVPCAPIELEGVSEDGDAATLADEDCVMEAVIAAAGEEAVPKDGGTVMLEADCVRAELVPATPALELPSADDRIEVPEEDLMVEDDGDGLELELVDEMRRVLAGMTITEVKRTVV